MKLKPYYPYNPIASIEALATTLGINPKLLQDLSNKVDDSYTEFLVTSKSGKDRLVYEPKHELKKLQKNINSRIFEHVEYPEYLQGGIKDEDHPRDYVENAKRHAHANQIICLDIKKFYPSIKYQYVAKIFQYFFKFSPEVSEVLSKLVTYKGVVPQGACTSSYIANLIFYDIEYLLVSELQRNNIHYSRLLDDITLSTQQTFSEDQKKLYILKIAAMFSKYQLKINNKKTRTEHRKDSKAGFEVTGVWIGHKAPKARKHERRFIRQLVYKCEQEYKNNHVSEEYHKHWNEASGKVAKLQRLGHIQAKDLRMRLCKVLPLYDENMAKRITQEVKKFCGLPQAQKARTSQIYRVNKLYYALGILSRNNHILSKSLRLQLNAVYEAKPTKQELWEN
jgi:hypothetical protein